MTGAASASAFWAQKSHTLKTSPQPTSVPATAQSPSLKTNGTATEKSHMVLKGKSNRVSTTTTSTKTDWADSDEDDEFMASFSAFKNPRIVSLEQQLEQKDVSIEALNAVLDTKNVRIAELEHIVERNDHLIASLENEMEMKDANIEQLHTTNHKQFLYVQELVSEVDGKSRRVQDLEAEIDQRCARIRELEVDLESQTQVSVDGTEKSDPKTDTMATEVINPVPASKAQADEAAPHAALSVCSPIITPVDQEQRHAENAPKSPTTGKELPSKQQGPAINTSMFPKLWTPDMAKKAAPVEKPKVLKMALDMSKFGKKSTPVAQKTEASSNKRSVTPTHSLSSKRRVKTAEVPEICLTKDIREMTHAERVIFSNGPDVTVMLGTIVLAMLPKYVLMQCSSIAYKYFSSNPNATSITFAAGSMDAEAAKAHLEWMAEMTYQGRVYSITLNGDEKNDGKNLKICRAARVLGLKNMYVGHFTKLLCDRVRSRPSRQFMSLICELAYPENDPIFECLANNLVNQTLDKDETKLSKDVRELCAQYPLLGEQLAKVVQRIKNSRAADRRRGPKSRAQSSDSPRK
ncbi:hypothetical protein IQ06DRAFT_364161 [Phaeosphaeriaceae sp. SRC1lsM3a]|nr:hypothetical protein IQ06DRAFT_364161 [Stagonospora sp. SRC1lsM3a]